MTTMSIRGVSLFVEVIGYGDPMVLMHGGPGSDHTTMSPLQACADRFTVVFYDHRCNGRSEGADIRFTVKGHGEPIEVFTTRPDTLWGATFMVFSPEHPLVDAISSAVQGDVYQPVMQAQTAVDRKGS